MAAGYPLAAFRFQVQIGGIRMGFLEVSGLECETEVMQYREGNYQMNYIKQPGLTKYSNVVLKHGLVAGNNDFINYWKKSQLSATFKEAVTISLLNEANEVVLSWTLSNAWASKIKYSSLNAATSEIVIESMELVHEGLNFAS